MEPATPADQGTARPLTARPGGALGGTIRVPGDKSLSHRALIMAALAVGESRLQGLLEGDDVLRTARAMAQLGADVARDRDGGWRVHGVGVGGLAEPDDVLDFGNSGTGARLTLGLIATHPITVLATGDASLRARPMARVLDPLALFGAEWRGRAGGYLPLALIGTGDPVPIDYEVPVASAQVKSALLYAALNTPGRTRIIERAATRDHTERLLAAAGADIAIDEQAGVRHIELTGHAELAPVDMTIPGDPSSAAYPVAAALLAPGSSVTIEGVLTNATRTGFYETLSEMGAAIRIVNERIEGGEPVGDIHVASGPLKAVEPPPERAPRMIDEFPMLFALAAFAEGVSTFRGLGELRVKESDRIGAMARGLAACGARVRELEDGLVVEGTGELAGGATVGTHMDHRIAMAFLTAGHAARQPITVDDGRMIKTSFPTFVDLMTGLGATIAAPAKGGRKP